MAPCFETPSLGPSTHQGGHFEYLPPNILKDSSAAVLPSQDWSVIRIMNRSKTWVDQSREGMK